MPVGGFLDSFPAILFVVVHLILIVLGIWALRRTSTTGRTYAWAFGLYILSQIVFLSFFGNVITIKMAVLLEQLLVAAMVIWIALGS